MKIQIFLIAATFFSISLLKAQTNRKEESINFISNGFKKKGAVIAELSFVTFNSAELENWMQKNNMEYARLGIMPGFGMGFCFWDNKSIYYKLKFTHSISGAFSRTYFDFGYYRPIVKKNRLLINAGGTLSRGWNDIDTEFLIRGTIPSELSAAVITTQMLENPEIFFLNQPFFSIGPGVNVFLEIPRGKKNVNHTYFTFNIGSGYSFLQKWRFGYGNGPDETIQRINLLKPDLPNSERFFLAIHSGIVFSINN